MSLGTPYVVHRPLMEGDLFIGRYKLLTSLEQAIKRGRKVLLVCGPTRIGKTSFLHRAAAELSAEFRVVHLSYDAARVADEGDLVSWLQREVAGTLGATSAQSGPAGDVLGRPVVVMLDAMSVADLKGERGAALMARCAEWTGSVERLHLAIGVNGTLQGVAQAAPSLASLPSVQLEPFDLDETEELLLKPAKGRLTYEFEAVRRIWQLTSGHPCLVQLYGHVLFLALAGSGRVGRHEVERALADVIAAADPVLLRMWQDCSAPAQVLLALGGEVRGGHGVLTMNELRGLALRHALAPEPQTIEDGMAELVGLGAMSTLSADSYRFSLELFRQWVAMHQPAAQVVGGRHGATAASWRRSSARRALRWSTVLGWVSVLAMVGAVIALWNMRGAGQRLVMGVLPTPTAPVMVTRSTLVIGPALGHIVYMAKDNPDAKWAIWSMRGDGSDSRRLTDGDGNDMFPTWSPDGRRVAFVSDRDGNREIYVMNADGTQQYNLTQHASEDWTPAWSPDGARIAFASYRDGNWEVYVMDADGGDPQRLTQQPGADYGPCWSPDNERIAFQTDRDGNWEIYAMGQDGTGLLRLTENDATDSAPAWSPDGTTIAHESYRDGNMEVYLMTPEGSDQRNVTNDPYSNEHRPAWARRGTRLLYYSNRDGGWDIISMKPDGTEKSNLTLSPAFEQAAQWHE